MRLYFCLIFVVLLLPSLALSQVLTEDFFPFGVENGDTAMASVYWANYNEIQIMDGLEFPYFNQKFKSIVMNNHGIISFSRDYYYQRGWSYTCDTHYYYYDTYRRIPMLLPFASFIDSSDGGNVFYRQTRNETLLLKATSEIQLKFPTIPIPALNWMFIATWDQVPSTFSSLYDKYCHDFSSRNSFQAVLATDGNESFGIFYYGNLTWTTARYINMNNNVCNNQQQAAVGFHSGDASSTYEISGSCGAAIRNVANNSNVNQSGKWVFRFDEEHPPCDGSGLTKKFHFSPSIISTLGHVQVSVVAPCLENVVEAKCEFTTPERVIIPAVMLPDKSAVICEAPFSYTNGLLHQFALNITRNSGSWSRILGQMYTFEFQDMPYPFQLNSDMTVTLSWTASSLGEADTMLELRLVEFSNGIWTPKGLLKANLQNTGQYNGALDDTTLISNLESFFLVQLQNKNPFPTYLFSSIQYTSLSRSEEYFDQRCNSWYENDNGPPLDLIPCPTLLSQIENHNDFERDRIATGELLDFYHPGAEHAFRQRYPTVHRGGQQCVYKNGTVLLGLRSGGRSELYSPNSPGGKAYHWRDDILPWYWCCKFTTSDESCAKFYEKRPADPVKSLAAEKGQILTFDHVSYPFSGLGEYWMVKTDDFLMQGRMDERNDESIFTSFVVKETKNQDSMHVQVSTSPMNGLQVFLHGEPIRPPPNHEEGTPFSLAENGLIITILSDQEVRMDFTSGFSFEFTTMDNISINVSPSAETGIKKRTVGLFGVVDGDSENDLTTLDGTVVLSNSAMNVIFYRDFVSKWKIGNGESLFVKEKDDLLGGIPRSPKAPLLNLKKEL